MINGESPGCVSGSSSRCAGPEDAAGATQKWQRPAGYSPFSRLRPAGDRVHRHPRAASRPGRPGGLPSVRARAPGREAGAEGRLAPGLRATAARRRRCCRRLARDMAALRVLRRAAGAPLCRASPAGRRAASEDRPPSVPQRIEEKRRAALLGGGQARIDAQHKRVSRGRRGASPRCPSRRGPGSARSETGRFRFATGTAGRAGVVTAAPRRRAGPRWLQGRRGAVPRRRHGSDGLPRSEGKSAECGEHGCLCVTLAKGPCGGALLKRH